MPLRLNGSTSGFSQLDAPAIAGDQTFTLPGTGGTIDRLNRAGNILQVVSATYGTSTTISSTSYADTGLTASITPSSTSSKILVLIQQPINPVGAAAVGYGNQTNCGLQLVRGATVLFTPYADSGGKYTMGFAASGTLAMWGIVSCSYLDSPSTTSSTTYKTQAAKGTSGMGSVYINESGGTSIITLLEVAA